LEPARFAEGLSRMGELHNDVAKYVAEDPTRSYEGHKMHQEIESLEGTWNSSVTDVKNSAARLTESNQKLMKVLRSVAESGLSFKSKLAEKTRLSEQLLQRGRGWKKLAESHKSELELTTKRAELAYECMDEFVRVYNEDTTLMGRRLLVLEFGKLTERPEIKKALKEATKPKHLLKVREALEKLAPKADAKETPVKADDKKVSPKPDETKKTDEKPDTKVESKKNEEKPVITEGADPRYVTETINIARRLSAAR
jgi:hypothetical protein